MKQSNYNKQIECKSSYKVIAYAKNGQSIVGSVFIGHMGKDIASFTNKVENTKKSLTKKSS